MIVFDGRVEDLKLDIFYIAGPIRKLLRDRWFRILKGGVAAFEVKQISWAKPLRFKNSGPHTALDSWKSGKCELWTS